MFFCSYRFVVIWLLSAAPAAFAQNALEKIPSKPLPCPESWLDFIGEYNSAAETLYVLEKDQALHVATKTQILFGLNR